MKKMKQKMWAKFTPIELLHLLQLAIDITAKAALLS